MGVDQGWACAVREADDLANEGPVRSGLQGFADGAPEGEATSVRIGVPSGSSCQSPVLNLQAPVAPPAPAKCTASGPPWPGSRLTLKRPLTVTAAQVPVWRLRQTSRLGGSAVTEQTAEAVMPQWASGPSPAWAVTMWESCPSRRGGIGCRSRSSQAAFSLAR